MSGEPILSWEPFIMIIMFQMSLILPKLIVRHDNAIELELPSTIRIYLVVNVSWVWQYKSQVEGQRKETPQPVVIEGEEEWEVEKIINKRKVWGRDKYLVW